MLDRDSARHITRRLQRQNWYCRRNCVCSDQGEVLIKRREVSGHSVACDYCGPHAYDKRSGSSGWKPYALNVVDEILLPSRRGVRFGEMVSVVDNAADSDFEVELVHIRGVRRRIAGWISPGEHNSKLFCWIGDHPRRFEWFTAALSEGSRWRFV